MASLYTNNYCHQVGKLHNIYFKLVYVGIECVQALGNRHQLCRNQGGVHRALFRTMLCFIAGQSLCFLHNIVQGTFKVEIMNLVNHEICCLLFLKKVTDTETALHLQKLRWRWVGHIALLEFCFSVCYLFFLHVEIRKIRKLYFSNKNVFDGFSCITTQIMIYFIYAMIISKNSKNKKKKIMFIYLNHELPILWSSNVSLGDIKLLKRHSSNYAKPNSPTL